MQLVACRACRTQYDVGGDPETRVRCACGEWIEVRPVEPVDAEVRRCGSCGGSVARAADACPWCGAAFLRDARFLSLVCPECYARNDEKGRYCTGCGIAFRPQPLPRVEKGLSCPVCRVDMSVRPVGGLLVQECPKCNGLWAPGESLNTLLDRALTALRDGRREDADPEYRRPPFQARVVYRRCPECNDPMQRKNFAGKSGVIVDWCGRHGTWLDADELEATAAYLAANAEAPAPGGWRLPSGEDRVRAIYTAEKLMAEERVKGQRRRRIFTVETPNPGRSLVDFLDDLLN